jgi:ABC-type antimicrobial peptide transport system permease subunit
VNSVGRRRRIASRDAFGCARTAFALKTSTAATTSALIPLRLHRGAVLALIVCAGVALLVPVQRASRVDPITVLR